MTIVIATHGHGYKRERAVITRSLTRIERGGEDGVQTPWTPRREVYIRRNTSRRTDQKDAGHDREIWPRNNSCVTIGRPNVCRKDLDMVHTYISQTICSLRSCKVIFLILRLQRDFLFFKKSIELAKIPIFYNNYWIIIINYNNYLKYFRTIFFFKKKNLFLFCKRSMNIG